MRRPKIEVVESAPPAGLRTQSRWWWRLVGANGEIMSAGEMYASKVDAIRGAKAARHAARLAKITIVSLVASLTLLAGTASAAPKTPHGPWHLICARALDHPAGYLCHMVKVLPTRRER